MTQNLPYLDTSGRLSTRGCGQCTGLRYGVEGRKIGPERPDCAGSLNLSTGIVARLFIAVLNRIHSQRPISLQKIILRQKQETMRIASLFSPIFRLTGRALEGAVIVVTM